MLYKLPIQLYIGIWYSVLVVLVDETDQLQRNCAKTLVVQVALDHNHSSTTSHQYCRTYAYQVIRVTHILERESTRFVDRTLR